MGTRMIHRSCVDGGKRGDHIDGKECAISSVVYQTTKYLSSFYFSLWQKGTKGGRWWAVGLGRFQGWHSDKRLLALAASPLYDDR